MIRSSSFGLVFAIALVAACGGQAPDPATPAATPPGNVKPPPGGPAGAAPTAWKDDLPMDQKAAFMKGHVVPRLGKVFQVMNAAHYADFGCKTCHGPKMKDPKEFLPHLAMKDGKMTAFAEKPEVAKFMAEKVVPEMAATLGEPPYDMTTHKGFGCAGCHTVDMK